MGTPRTLRFLTALLFACCLACHEPLGPTPEGPALGTVRGRTAHYDGMSLEVGGWWLGWGIEPAPGPRLDTFLLRVVNDTGSGRRFDPRDLRLEDADGTYWPRVVVGVESELRPITLAAFEGANGWAFFRIAADARPVAVVWLVAPGLPLRIPLPPERKPGVP